MKSFPSFEDYSFFIKKIADFERFKIDSATQTDENALKSEKGAISKAVELKNLEEQAVQTIQTRIKETQNRIHQTKEAAFVDNAYGLAIATLTQLKNRLANPPRFKTVQEQIVTIESQYDALKSQTYIDEPNRVVLIQRDLNLNLRDRRKKYNEVQSEFNALREKMDTDCVMDVAAIRSGKKEASALWKSDMQNQIEQATKKVDSLFQEAKKRKITFVQQQNLEKDKAIEQIKANYAFAVQKTADKYEILMAAQVKTHLHTLEVIKLRTIAAKNEILKEVADSLYQDLTPILDISAQPTIQSLQIGNFIWENRKLRTLIPLQKGVAFHYTQRNRQSVFLQTQYTILHLLQQVVSKLVEITLIDFTIEDNFNKITPLSDVIELSVLTQPKNFNSIIEKLRQTAIDKNQNFLAKNGYETLVEYNKNVEHPEPYQIVVLTDSWRTQKHFNNDYLIELLEKGYKTGIFFIALLESDWFASKQLESQAKNQVFDMDRNHVLKIYDAFEKELVNVKTNSNNLVAISNIENIDFQWITQKYSFEYVTATTQEIQLIQNRFRQKIAASSISSDNFISVPVGKVGNNLVHFELGDKNGCYNAFVAGSVGSGKSNLLKHLILSIAEQYSPDKVHFLLMDYKEGTEFQVFRTLPHTELLLLDNSRLEVAKNVLEDFLNEKKIRAHKFTEMAQKHHVSIANILIYNKYASEPMPLKLLIIDEIHELFFGGWRQNKDFQESFQLIVRQGRAYGLHIIVSTQNLEGFELGEGIMEQIRLRLSFNLSSDKECRHILKADNTIPLDLDRFEAVLNTHHGKADNKLANKKHNIVFKSTFIGDEKARIAAIRAKWTHFLPFEQKVIEVAKSTDNNIVEDLFMPKKQLEVKSQETTITPSRKNEMKGFKNLMDDL